jgi:methylated-DNA-[protein]-cysteine S-methyltransferase
MRELSSAAPSSAALSGAAPSSAAPSSAAPSSAAPSSAALSGAAPSSAALSGAALAWASLTTPVGLVSVGVSAAGVAQVRYGAPAPAHESDLPGPGRELAETARRQLTEYFTGHRREFDLPLDWSPTAGPQREVLRLLASSVGYGRTIRYGELATRAGLTATDDTIPARAVGKIMGSNPIPVIVPCHRVLASDGLGGYSGGAGIEVKRWLLILEGSLPPTLDWQAMQGPA